MSKEKFKGLSIKYDPWTDVLTIDGVKYSGDVFRSGFRQTPDGHCWRTLREDGDDADFVTIEQRIHPDKPAPDRREALKPGVNGPTETEYGKIFESLEQKFGKCAKCGALLVHGHKCLFAFPAKIQPAPEKPAAREWADSLKLIQKALSAVRPYLPGTVLTRDVGSCEACGNPTTSGVKRFCAKCVGQLVKNAIEAIEKLLPPTDPAKEV